MTNIVIPNGGVTDDQTPELRIVTNAPLGAGVSIHVVRNGVDVGMAAPISPTEFSFTDSVVDGVYHYVAELRYGQTVISSAEYVVTVESYTPPPVSQFFSSVLYGYLQDERLTVSMPQPLTGQIFNPVTDHTTVAMPTITGGTLSETISFVQGNSSVDVFGVSLPPITDGSLIDTISFKQANASIDGLGVGIPPITGGSLAVVISFVAYTSSIDGLGVNVPTITSGSLA